MTREEIKAEFKTSEDGVILSPGKFEGEMVYAPHYYGRIIEGDGEEKELPDGSYSTFFEVTDEERQEFPELGDIQVVECYQNDAGQFFCVEADKA